jgi:uracil-DNA glycosylase
MHNIIIKTIPGVEEWRDAARDCLQQGLNPLQINWGVPTMAQEDLFTEPPVNTLNAPQAQNYKISAELLSMLDTALRHSAPERFDICYSLLWRSVQGDKNLLHKKTDNDVMHFERLIKAVRRDAYKITAFLRFREIEQNGNPIFIAWYEPEHYTLELKLDFFMTRFKNMRWSILTPYRAAHWNMAELTLEDNPDPTLYPDNDKIEKYWLTYYANIFNPARPKKGAMLSQMPKKYWKNMPETALIKDLLHNSENRAREMVERSRQINRASGQKEN